MILKLVVDANILFSFFKQDSTARELITRFEFRLYAPELALEELFKYKELICEKSGISDRNFDESIKTLKTFVSFETEDFFKELLPKSKEISPDIDDVTYFALALKLNCGIWSNDKLLKRQSIVEVLSTKELIKFLSKSKP